MAYGLGGWVVDSAERVLRIWWGDVAQDSGLCVAIARQSWIENGFEYLE